MNSLSKKAQVNTQEMFKQLFYAFLILLYAVVSVLVFRSAVHREVDSESLEQHIAIYRVLESENCLGFKDGAISLVRFNEENLNNCFNFDSKKNIGLNLNLFSLNGSEISGVEINKEMVTQRITCGLKGSKSECYKTRYYVLIDDYGKLSQGILDLEVVVDVE